MNFFQASGFIRYLIISKSRSGHGVHSPFVFDLVSRVFRNKINNDVVCCIEETRKRLLRDERIIEAEDHGTGQKLERLRKVSVIARNSAIPQKYGILLSRLASEYGRGAVLELGTSLGISTMYLAAGSPASRVYTVDACGECQSVAYENYRKAGFTNIENITGTFDLVLPGLSGIRPGFVFIDGDHRKEALLENFSILAEQADPETVIAIDDIYLSRGMSDAWNDIKQHANVSFTVDVFRMGLVFFKKGITRNSYVIRY